MVMSLRLQHRSGRWIPPLRIGTGVMLGGGLCIGTAYALVIHAMRVLPATEVVAYTNAGIVLATLASIVVFKERMHWRVRCVGVLLICLGLASLAAGRSFGS
jgi:multidrug transporter EmrE-like cation transporter